ncbi:MAG: hypothetical protein VYC34_07545, partial [Planctomycetota bacterium]|nr:hypothetical protein [Planctomycetota bacterium]
HGPQPNTTRGDGEEPEIPEVPPTTPYIETDVFAGKFSIFTQMIDGGAAEHQVFYIPSPAPITVALIAGAAGAARRRR